MSSPQKENGYTMIANELIEALASIRIAGEEMQCLLVIFRKTYGWNKKKDKISLSQFVLMTGLKKQSAHRALKKLIQKRLISVSNNDDGQTITYGFNKDYSKWIPSAIMLNTKERKKLTKEKLIGSFDLFWNEYSRKVKKKKSKEIWVKKIKPDAALFEKIMAGLKKAKQSPEWQKENGKFIPHPTTWLNGERWEDDLERKNDERTKFF